QNKIFIQRFLQLAKIASDLFENMTKRREYIFTRINDMEKPTVPFFIRITLKACNSPSDIL
ncbi:short transient receptor potential channel 3, partial [Biomphalaria glabrata]